MKKDQLMRLRIPGSWWVAENRFWDFDPNVEEEEEFPISMFIEDIASMIYRVPYHDRGIGGTGERPYAVDLGWYPDGARDGCFRLELLSRDCDAAVGTFKSRDRFAVRDMLEQWLDQVERARDHEQLERWVVADMP